MALYHGFFDFSAEVLEETGKYDREYNAEDFMRYFASFLGSGVCVYQNPDSMKASLESGRILVAPGYLFLQGYWLANQAGEGEDPAAYRGYWLDLPGSGAYAVAARLDLSRSWLELAVLPQAESYPDCLVLALVDGEKGTVTDVRGDMDLCGLVDALGDLSPKVEYAVHYIDNEIEDRLKEAEAQIAAQEALLDQKIQEVAAEVEKIAPPPIGTVQYTASQNVGEGWLRCDGSFINEADYPELVQALGKLTPSAADFHEAYEGAVGSGVSNGVAYGGAHWLFSLTSGALYKYDPAAKAVSAIPVTGTESLSGSTANEIWLSITGGSLFLTQIQGTSKTVALLEAPGFTGEEASLAMTELPLREKIASYLAGITSNKPDLPGEAFIPEICMIPHDWGEDAGGMQDTFFLCLGLYSHSSQPATSVYYFDDIYYIMWKKGAFESAAILFYTPNGDSSGISGYGGIAKNNFRFSHKNSNELAAFQATKEYEATFARLQLVSYPNHLLDGTQSIRSGITGFENDIIATTCVAGNSRYLYRCFVRDKGLVVRAGTYNPMSAFSQDDPQPTLSLPSRAQIFPDSVVYCASQDLWFVFLGTGIAFSPTPEQAETWGYLDTQERLGVISRFGSVEVDEDRGLLFLSGQDTQNQGRLGVLKLPPLFQYANDGAWLPMLAADGVPAYIKAKASGPEEPEETVLTVTVVPPAANNSPTINGYAVVVVNGEVLGEGVYPYTSSGSGAKISVGIRAINTTTRDIRLFVNGSALTTLPKDSAEGEEKRIELSVSRYLESGLTLQLS